MSPRAFILAASALLLAASAHAEPRPDGGARGEVRERVENRRAEWRQRLGDDWDEVLVVADGDALELAGRHSGTVRGNGRWKALKPPKRGNKHAWYRKLQADPDVVALQPNYHAHHPGCRQMSIDIFETGEILQLIGQLPIRQINGESGLAAPGVIVAVVDSGVADVEELEGRLLPPLDLLAPGSNTRSRGRGNGRHLAADDPAAWDGNGHGTAMASLIASLAGESLILPVRVVGDDCVGNVYDLARGIRLAADAGAQVISVSLGTQRWSAVLEEAVDHAASLGCLVVAAAGNSGEVEYPARFASALAVTAVDAANAPAAFAPLGVGIDLAAPGVDVTARVPETSGPGYDYARFSGTSPATALAAAAAAAVVARTPGEDAAVRRGILLRAVHSARDLGPDADGALGAGVLDVSPLR